MSETNGGVGCPFHYSFTFMNTPTMNSAHPHFGQLIADGSFGQLIADGSFGQLIADVGA
jgi:hypothetical protein